jgi:hypothetical protein
MFKVIGSCKQLANGPAAPTKPTDLAQEETFPAH